MEQSDFTKELENKEIKNRLEFFKNELIEIKNSQQDDRVIPVIGKLIDFIDTISLSYRQYHLLRLDIDYLAQTKFNAYSRDGKINDENRKILDNACDKLIHSLDLHLRSPEKILYKRKKQGFFEKVFNKNKKSSSAINKMFYHYLCGNDYCV